MCIIAIKPAKAAKPTREMFDAMIKGNPDGFGYMTWSAEKGLQVRKTMDSKLYLKWVNKIPDEQPVVYHMRIATHGSVQVKNCHPFQDATKTWGFAHNGVLSIHNEGDMTDSETFFKRIAMPFIYAGMLPESKPFDKMVEAIIGYSKFVFLHRGEIFKYGNFIKEGDLYFSNTSYKPYPKVTYVRPVCSGYGYTNCYGHYYGHGSLFDDFEDDFISKPASTQPAKTEPQLIGNVIEQAVSTDVDVIPVADQHTYGLKMSDKDFDKMCEFLEDTSGNDFCFQFRSLENIMTLCEEKYPDADEDAVTLALSLCEIKYAQPCLC